DEFAGAYRQCGLSPEAIKSSYAMAENVFAVTQSPVNEPPRRLWVDGNELSRKNLVVPVAPRTKGSVCFVSSGRCLRGNHVRIVSAQRTPLPDGNVGEILIRSDSLLTATTIAPNWGQRRFKPVGTGLEISAFD
ncbi:MAG TPA: hypothetical protein VHM64_15020, partial [Candidatus Binatia bacterium]|nr:hypothetical protein [Candidatus Binatia bacterium]